MFSAGTLTFQEFMAREKLPLATIQNAVLEFLRDRKDAVVFGAQAVNAYVKEPRMTQEIDLLSTRAEDLAGELQEYLRHLAMLLLTFPELKRESGPVLERLQAVEADPAILAVWNELVTQEITPADDDEF